MPPISHLCSFLGTYVSNVPDSVIDPESYSLEKYRQNVNRNLYRKTSNTEWHLNICTLQFVRY